MKYYVIAGEASGDLHGANLIKALKTKDEQAVFRTWGGDLMAAQGAEVVKHYRDLAFMGFAEVIMNLRTIMGNFKFCKEDLLAFQPDVLVLIDYPGFNLRMAEFAHQNGIKVFYYISPQVWAWKQSRVHKIKKFVDRMFVILPFETEFYNRFNYNVDFVGHPLLDALGERRKQQPAFDDFTRNNGLGERPLVALLPGSRKQEISKMLPAMLSVVDDFTNYQFVVAGAPSHEISFYQEIIGEKPVKVLSGKTYDILQQASAALVTSGTATLETALFKVPEVVCYTGNKISYYIARMLVKIKYISLVNLIMDRLVIKELIQDDLNYDQLKTELGNLLNDGPYRNEMLKNFDELAEILGGEGASDKTASLMIKYLKTDIKEN